MQFEKTELSGWPFKLLAIDDEVFITGYDAVKIQRKAHKYAEQMGRKFTCKADNGGVYVKRIS